MAKRRNGKIARGAEYRMNEQFQNLPIFEISIVFQIAIWKIKEFSNFYNLENQYFII